VLLHDSAFVSARIAQLVAVWHVVAGVQRGWVRVSRPRLSMTSARAGGVRRVCAEYGGLRARVQCPLFRVLSGRLWAALSANALLARRWVIRIRWLETLLRPVRVFARCCSGGAVGQAAWGVRWLCTRH
jgi:hypothetical protein